MSLHHTFLFLLVPIRGGSASKEGLPTTLARAHRYSQLHVHVHVHVRVHVHVHVRVHVRVHHVRNTQFILTWISFQQYIDDWYRLRSFPIMCSIWCLWGVDNAADVLGIDASAKWHPHFYYSPLQFSYPMMLMVGWWLMTDGWWFTFTINAIMIYQVHYSTFMMFNVQFRICIYFKTCALCFLRPGILLISVFV